MPGCMVCPLFWNNHITAPHETAANTEKYRESGGRGLVVAPLTGAPDEYGEVDRGINDATTRDTTYNTI